jgi:hypothetical protein
MSATHFEPVLPNGNVRATVEDLVAGKVLALIEDDKQLIRKVCATHEQARQWIKENL